MVDELVALYKSLDKFSSDKLRMMTIEFGESLLR